MCLLACGLNLFCSFLLLLLLSFFFFLIFFLFFFYFFFLFFFFFFYFFFFFFFFFFHVLILHLFSNALPNRMFFVILLKKNALLTRKIARRVKQTLTYIFNHFIMLTFSSHNFWPLSPALKSCILELAHRSLVMFVA
jgi:hypothetical protein